MNNNHIENLFHKYKIKFEDEFNNDNWVENRKELLNELYKSLELIGGGEIVEKPKYDYDGDRLMYKELLKNNTLILVVHASFVNHPYGGGKLYSYEISVYKNNPSIQQIGGGYGTSGIMSIKHTRILGSIETYYCRNKNIISATCNEIKKYIDINF